MQTAAQESKFYWLARGHAQNYQAYVSDMTKLHQLLLCSKNSGVNIAISVPGTLISCTSVCGMLLPVTVGASDGNCLGGRETGGGGGGGGGVDIFFFLPRFFGTRISSSLDERFLFLFPFFTQK